MNRKAQRALALQNPLAREANTKEEEKEENVATILVVKKIKKEEDDVNVERKLRFPFRYGGFREADGSFRNMDGGPKRGLFVGFDRRVVDGGFFGIRNVPMLSISSQRLESDVNLVSPPLVEGEEEKQDFVEEEDLIFDVVNERSHLLDRFPSVKSVMKHRDYVTLFVIKRLEVVSFGDASNLFGAGAYYQTPFFRICRNNLIGVPIVAPEYESFYERFCQDMRMLKMTTGFSGTIFDLLRIVITFVDFALVEDLLQRLDRDIEKYHATGDVLSFEGIFGEIISLALGDSQMCSCIGEYLDMSRQVLLPIVEPYCVQTTYPVLNYNLYVPAIMVTHPDLVNESGSTKTALFRDKLRNISQIDPLHSHFGQFLLGIRIDYPPLVRTLVDLTVVLVEDFGLLDADEAIVSRLVKYLRVAAIYQSVWLFDCPAIASYADGLWMPRPWEMKMWNAVLGFFGGYTIAAIVGGGGIAAFGRWLLVQFGYMTFVMIRILHDVTMEPLISSTTPVFSEEFFLLQVENYCGFVKSRAKYFALDNACEARTKIRTPVSPPLLEITSFENEMDRIPTLKVVSLEEFGSALTSGTDVLTVCEDGGQELTKITLMLIQFVQLWRCKNPIDVLLQFSNMALTWIPKQVYSLFTSLVDQVRAMIQHLMCKNEADDFCLDKVFNEQVVTTPQLFNKVGELVSLLSICSVMTTSGVLPDFAKKVMDKVLSVIDVRNRDIFAKKVIDVATTTVKLLYECFKQGSLRPLYMTTGWTVSRYCKVAQNLTTDSRIEEESRWATDSNFIEALDKGDIDAVFVKRLPKASRLAVARRLITVGNDLLKVHVDSQSQVLGEKKRLLDAHGAVSTYALALQLAMCSGSIRPQPYGLYVWGSAGCGKSSRMNAILATVASVLGIEYAPHLACVYDPGANFQTWRTGLNLFMTMDDVDQKTVDGKLFDFVSPWMNLVNSTPLVLESAAVDEKGTNHFAAEMVTFVSNFADTAHPNMIPCKQAFHRRVRLQVEVKAKKIYSRTNEQGVNFLDPTQIPDGVQDVSTYTLRRYNPANGQHGKYELVAGCEDMNLLSFLKFLKSDFTVYRREQIAYADSQNASSIGQTCPCGITLSAHDGRVPCDLEFSRDPTMINENLVADGVTFVRGFGQMQIDVVNGLLESFNVILFSGESLKIVSFYLLIVLWLFMGAISLKSLLAILFLVWLCVVIRPYWEDIKVNFFRFTSLFLLRSLFFDSWWSSMAWRFIDTARVFELIEDRKEILFVEQLKKNIETIKRTSALLAAGTLAALVYNYCQSDGPPPQVEVVKSEEEFVVKDRPRGNDLGGVSQYIKLTGVTNYVTAAQETHPAKTTSEAIACDFFAKRTVFIQSGTGQIKGFIYAANVVVFPAHIFSPDSTTSGRTLILPLDGTVDISLRVAGIKTSHVLKVPWLRIRKIPSRDLVMMYIPSLFPTEATKLFPIGSFVTTVQNFDSGFLLKVSEDGSIEKVELDGKRSPRFVTLSSNNQNSLPYLSYGKCTTKGDCGSIVFGRLKNVTYPIGMHVIGATVSFNEEVSVGEELTGLDLAAGFANLMKIHKSIKPLHLDTSQLSHEMLTKQVFVEGDLVNVNEDFERGLELVDMPLKKSSYLAADSQGDLPFIPLGMLKSKVHSGDMKTSIVNSRNRKVIDAFFVTHFGIENNYVTPVFKGKMVDGVWRDPFVYNLLTSTNKNGDPLIWDLAMKDYLVGAEEMIGLDQVRPLTWFESLNGVAGEIKGVNLKTSAGPPLAGKKSQFIVKKEGEVLIDVRLMNQVDRLSEAWNDGIIVPTVMSYTLKDEVITMEKNAECRIRVFNNVSFAANLCIKQLLGPIANLLMLNRAFSECYGGINMVSEEVDVLVKEMLQMSGDGEGFFAGDYKNFDVKQCTEVLLRIASILKFIAKLCGYTEELQEKSYTAVLSTMYTVRVIKGDLFLCTFTNPSGGLLTLIINSLTNSLNCRYVYYKEKLRSMSYDEIEAEISNGDVFRAHVKLGVVGDDNVGAVQIDSRNLFNQQLLQAHLPEVGHVYTDANKTEGDISVFTPFSEVTFLKRNFVFDSSINRWKAPIALKSILKMLAFTKKSDEAVSISLQEGQILENALRESYLHGREIFNNVSSLILLCKENHFYDRPLDLSYEQLENSYIKGELVTWTMMENESSDFGPISTMVTDAPVASTSGSSAGELGERGAASGNSSISKWFQRTVVIGNGSFSNSDAVGQKFVHNDVLDSYFGHPAIAPKMKGSLLWRGDFNIILEISGNPMQYGLYTAAVYPLKSGSIDGAFRVSASHVNDKNIFQLDHANLDVSQSNHISLACPFISEYGYVNVITGEGDCGWRVEIICNTPTSSAIDPTMLCVVNYTLYFQPGENFEISVPTNEAKVRSHKSISRGLGTASRVATMLSTIPEIGPIAGIVGTGLSVAQTIADAFGYTKTQSEKSPISAVLSNGTNVATTDGEFTGQMVGLASGNSVTIDPHLGGDGDENNDIAMLGLKQTLIKRVTWTSVMGRGSLLTLIPICPGFSATGTFTGIQLTVAGGLSLPFEYWAGSMIYELVVVSSGYHTGSLTIGWTSDSTPDPNSLISMTNNVVLDISTEKAHMVKVSMRSMHNMLVNKVGITLDQFGNHECNGYLYVYVHNPLSSPNPAANVTVNILASSGSDIQFGKLRVNSPLTANPYRVYPKTSNEGDDLRGPSIEESTLTDLTGSSGVNMCHLLCGEKISGVRAMMQKFSYLVSVSPLVEAPTYSFKKTTFHVPFYPPAYCEPLANNAFYPPDPDGAYIYKSNYLSYYSSFYAGVRGSVRLKGFSVSSGYEPSQKPVHIHFSHYNGPVANTIETINFQDHTGDRVYDPNQYSLLLGLDAPGTLVASQDVIEKGFEYTFPSYMPYKFINTNLGFPTTIGSAKNRWIRGEVIHYAGLSPRPLIINIYQAGGADICPVYFLCVPPMILNQ